MVRDVYIYYIILCVLTVIPAELDHDVGTRRVHPVRRGFDQTVTLGRNKILRSNRSVSPRTAGGGRGSQCSTRVYIHNDTRIRFYCRPVRCENRSGKKKINNKIIHASSVCRIILIILHTIFSPFATLFGRVVTLYFYRHSRIFRIFSVTPQYII